jgi:type II restriction enzyme
LIGKKDLKKAIADIYNENPNAFDVLNILIAVRNNKTKFLDDYGNVCQMEDFFKSPEKIYKYIKDTGLEEIFKNKDIKNLVDYVFGVEVGLDTHARKNRFGKKMIETVKEIFDNNSIKYETEVPISKFPDIKNFEKDDKKIDLVIRTSKKIYLTEVNFYEEGGSKPNETTRSYATIASKIKQYSNKYEFVWITDGKGWIEAKNELEEAFSVIDKIYNLKTINEFIKIIKMEMENE